LELAKLNERSISARPRNGSKAAVGGVVGAVLASTCCIGPLLLITLGASGAWIGNLTALKEYQSIFVAATLVFLGLGFWQVYGKTEQSCNDDSYCATPKSDRIIKSALWIATCLVCLALTVDFWAPLFY
jgi:mercuric ion transport protein